MCVLHSIYDVIMLNVSHELKVPAEGFGLILSMFITTFVTIKQTIFVMQTFILECNVDFFPYGCKSFYMRDPGSGFWPKYFSFIWLFLLVTVFIF